MWAEMAPAMVRRCSSVNASVSAWSWAIAAPESSTSFGARRKLLTKCATRAFCDAILCGWLEPSIFDSLFIKSTDALYSFNIAMPHAQARNQERARTR